MQTIEIARRLAELDQTQDACNAYTLALHQGELTPEEELEAAVYILQTGGDYKVSYTALPVQPGHVREKLSGNYDRSLLYTKFQADEELL